MNFYISFASPHTGICDSTSYLIRTGIWYLTNFEKAKNLKQLNCQPDENDEVYLKRLSESDTLTWFKKFVVVSSKEDNFVPFNSSRLDADLSDHFSKDMCSNIKKRIKKL
jgi:hypothetical protein